MATFPPIFAFFSFSAEEVARWFSRMQVSKPSNGLASSDSIGRAWIKNRGTVAKIAGQNSCAKWHVGLISLFLLISPMLKI